MPSEEQISISKVRMEIAKEEVTLQLKNARLFVTEVEKYLNEVYQK